MKRIVTLAFYLAASGVVTGLMAQSPNVPAAGAGSLQPPKNALHDPRPVVALTFDDLPAASSIPAGETRTQIAANITAVLKANHLEGTYGMVNASQMEHNPDAQQALRLWVSAGMKIGNHTWSHLNLNDLSIEAYEQEIARNEATLNEYAPGSDWHWFRYPFLAEGDTLEKRHAIRGYLQSHGYRVAQVTLSFNDYAWNEPYVRCLAKPDVEALAWLRQSYLENAAESLRAGREQEITAFGHEIPNVMLLHETSFTTLMLPQLIDLIRQEGLRFATLPEVEKDPVYALDTDTASQWGGTLPGQFLNLRHLPYPKSQPVPFEKLQNICR
jgi:peptidoglycan/xylan/chitin deacetylase (PgdA/CDA1 family)